MAIWDELSWIARMASREESVVGSAARMASREESVVGSAAAQLAASAAKLAAAAAASASSSTSVVVRSTELAVAPDAPPKDYYYPLYRLLLRWKQFALPPSAPHAALLPPPDATTTTPLSHLLTSLAGLQRARRGAHERLRSVRRWQMLYASRQRLPTGRLAPPTCGTLSHPLLCPCDGT